LLLRRGIVYPAGRAWTDTHDVWLRGQRFDQRAVQSPFESDYEAIVVQGSP
jgi:hypothetical protein